MMIMRTRTSALLIVALVALAACAGGVSAQKAGHVKAVHQAHAAKHDAARKHVADVGEAVEEHRDRARTMMADLHEAMKEHHDAARERFTKAMSDVLKAGALFCASPSFCLLV